MQNQDSTSDPGRTFLHQREQAYLTNLTVLLSKPRLARGMAQQFVITKHNTLASGFRLWPTPPKSPSNKGCSDWPRSHIYFRAALGGSTITNPIRRCTRAEDSQQDISAVPNPTHNPLAGTLSDPTAHYANALDNSVT